MMMMTALGMVTVLGMVTGYPPWDGDCPRDFDHHKIQANWNRQADKPRYWEACVFLRVKIVPI